MKRRRRTGPSWQLPTLLLGALVWVGSVVGGDLLGGVLTRIRWVAGALLVLGLLAWIGRQLLPDPPEKDPPEPPPADQPVPLPAPPELTGRAAELAAALRTARQHGVLLLHGPRGIGTSALALATAAELAAAAGPGTYADLRASAGRPEPPARARARVLAALGLPPDATTTDEGLYDLVAGALRDTGRVLLLDNVRDRAQVAWLRRPVPGAYVLVAGDLPPEPDQPDLPVGPLGPEDGLALLRADPAVAPRVQARRDARDLARRYLNVAIDYS